MKKLLPIMIIVSILFSTFCFNFVEANAEEIDYKTSEIYSFVKELCEVRANYAKTQTGVTHAMFIKEKFESVDEGIVLPENIVYSVSESTFTLNNEESLYTTTISGTNIVAKIDNSNTAKQIIIGAHYDFAGGEGATDNATGIATMYFTLQTLLQNADKLSCDIVFVAFDLEEYGLYGSDNYVYNMTEDEKSNTMLMINFDCVAGGDNLYLYCENKSTTIADLFIKNNSIGEKLTEKPYSQGIISFIDSYGYGYYEVAQSSDNSSFRLEGIPTALFFAGYYDFVTGYSQSKDSAKCVMNTASDTFAMLDANYGEKFVSQIETVVDTITATILCDEFCKVAENAVNELVDLELWKNSTWPKVISGGIIAIAFVLFLIFDRKLQKQSIMGTAEATPQSQGIFTKPNAEDIFTFDNSKGKNNNNSSNDDIFKF